MVRQALTLPPAPPLVLAGPTAVGKSDLAVEIARRCNGLIICGDSRQLYTGMQIGAAAPSLPAKETVPHLGFGSRPADPPQDANGFIRDADGWVKEAQAQGKQPIIVGGAGLYLRAFRYGLDDVPKSDKAIRAALTMELEEYGLAALHEKLKLVDPKGAATIHQNDPVRVVRALELFRITGTPPSQLRKSHGGRDVRVQAKWVLLEASMAWLSERLRQRVLEMFSQGLVQEAVALRSLLGGSHRLLDTMGYKEALGLYDGSLTQEEAIQETYRRHRQFARRQRTWFQKETWWQRIPADSGDLADQVLDFADLAKS
jgi:tRNA dimethylallyltransferase